MNIIGQQERVTQQRVIDLFRDALGYRYLGDWTDRADNGNIEESLLTTFLAGRGYSAPQISAVVHRLRNEALNHSRDLYENNKAVYELLRYGVTVKTDVAAPSETVQLIDWDNPDRNDFAVAEEVTLRGANDRRPDLVLYVNGLAVAVIELKRSTVSIGDGIRQCISNQRPTFHAWFFSTVQFLIAGSDSEGMKYASIGTEEKYWLRWKEDEGDDAGYVLDKHLRQMCGKDRLLELMHDFVLFDAGRKKLPRVHQFFAIKRAQHHVRQRQGGIIWHTQGSGKSIVMVLLARWILENLPSARILIVTDRDELDKQIERFFRDSGETMHRCSSGQDLMGSLENALPRLLCTLVHKFGVRGSSTFDDFIEELTSRPARTVGELFIFVDECHRTQSGRLHLAMKAMLPSAVFIGFTGTPLLRRDRQTSREVFGGYIHTYRFNEAVEDGVVLDLVYEARDISQHLLSEEKVDAWFDAKTRGLNDWQKAELKTRWGTMQTVLSSKSRMERIVQDVELDFSVRPRLSSARGNAILIASSIYEACRYFEFFQRTGFRGRCALVTSYNPNAQDITKEDTGANTDTDRQFIYRTYTDLLAGVTPKAGKSRTETYEDDAKDKFVREPANMRLLIVVDKLLTGFDAPPCTYLYIDKSMQDHGLFQAICRTNRLDGDDKDFGYIIDYKDLFTKVGKALAVYASELDVSDDGPAPEILLEDRLTRGRERLDAALEVFAHLCEPVPAPKSDLEYIHYFCGNPEVASALQKREPQRVALYTTVVALVRAYAAIADELRGAGYESKAEEQIKRTVENAVRLRDMIRRASGEVLDLKPYEADMRHLIDTYIQADDSRTVSKFEDMPLLDLIVNSGIADAIAQKLGSMQGDKRAIAETIANNVRSTIIREHLNDPAFYDRMSKLLDDILEQLKAKRLEYEEYLGQIAGLAEKVKLGYDPHDSHEPAELRNNPALRALYNNLKSSNHAGRVAQPPPAYASSQDALLELAKLIDAAVRRVMPDDFRGNPVKENIIKQELYNVLGDEEEVERLFLVIKAQKEY